MQLVVMAAVLALVDARQSCSSGCNPRNTNISVVSCGKIQSIFTTICEGQCYHELSGGLEELLSRPQYQTCHCVSSVLVYSLITRVYSLRDPVYMSPWYRTKQNVCNGDWSYEVKHFKDCPVGVTYPVAKNCQCTTCNEDNTDCGRVPWIIPGCLASYVP